MSSSRNSRNQRPYGVALTAINNTLDPNLNLICFLRHVTNILICHTECYEVANGTFKNIEKVI